ncbi:MAG: endonuclease V [Actinomycetota bacterium]
MSIRLFCCVDVDYRVRCVVAACVGFERWTDEQPSLEIVVPSFIEPAPYQSGQFYLREMPYLLELIDRLPTLPSVILVDGFVWLGPASPGLGAHLYKALKCRAAVVGVAKRPYRQNAEGASVLRGHSRRPLIVTAVGIELGEAARGVASMHGRSRIPTLIRRADRLSREHASSSH